MLKYIEKYVTLFMALSVCCVIAYYSNEFVLLINSQVIKLENLYTSFFDLFSILAAFLFGFYAFVRADATEFISKIKQTKTYEIFITYLLHGTLLSAMATIVCIPLIIVEPKPQTDSEFWFYYISIWAVFSAYSISSAFRAATIFAIITRVEIKSN